MITAQLLVTLASHAFSGLIMLGSGFFVLLQNPKKKLNVFYFIFTIPLFIYEASFVAGPLMPSESFAYGVWFINIVDVFITATVVHLMFAVSGLENRFRWYLKATYGVAFAIFAAAIVYPHLFLPQVVPKLYFPWYLDAGPLYVVMFVFFMTAPIFPYIKLVQASTGPLNRIKLEYFVFMFALGYAIGPWNFALVFDYQIDPLYGSPLWLGTIPIAYGIIADQLFDIRLVLKRALFYSLSIGGITGFLALLIFLNDYLVDRLPWIQFWTVPIFTGALAFIVGRVIWSKFAENERVKYEFITVATHKLRTPLTQISWGLRELVEASKEEKPRELALRIQQASNRLIELTNIIFEATQKDDGQYSYTKEKVGLIGVTKDVFAKLGHLIIEKRIEASIHVDGEVYVMADERRIRSVIEVFLENAVVYTPEGGFVQVIAYEKGNRVIYSVRDSGIGVSGAERKSIFMRFYRTDAAKRADTEGVGLGLAMAKNIIDRHGGRIGMESPGEGKGSTFWFSIPHGIEAVP